jgi:hypothetical protein
MDRNSLPKLCDTDLGRRNKDALSKMARPETIELPRKGFEPLHLDYIHHHSGYYYYYYYYYY